MRTEVLRRVGVPTLALQGDSWSRRMVPMSMLQGQIDEFVNNVVTKKGKRRR